MSWSGWLAMSSKPKCDRCGWQGEKKELIPKQVELEFLDSLTYSVQWLMLFSPPTHRVEYRCPICGELLASDVKFYQSYYDQESFPD